MAFTPSGTSDTLIKECESKQKLINLLQKVYKSHGFRQVETPSFEYYDTLFEFKNTINKDSTLKLIDKAGKVTVLRPDTTLPIARLVASNYKDFDDLLKLRYNMQVYRTSAKESTKEITQSGVELFGSNSPFDDAEVLVMAIESLLSCGIDDFQIDIGHIGYIKAMLEGLDDQTHLQQLIANKNFLALADSVDKLNIDSQRKDAIKKLPNLYGKFDEIISTASANTQQAKNAIESLNKIFEVLSSLDYAKYVSFDLGMMHDLNYYSGIVFSAYIKGYGTAVLSGGRYDGLIKQENCPACRAVGFSVYIDYLLQAIQLKGIELKAGQQLDVLLVGSDASKLFVEASKLRAQGKIVDIRTGKLNDLQIINAKEIINLDD
ncbi:MAG: ATP phosphoribosyltransferase regulatory subunit [Coriobacteriales bacterium]|nr:ATP phosphoribosyltransferase regulatory subunit [Coriobacteriales bacterium]